MDLDLDLERRTKERTPSTSTPLTLNGYSRGEQLVRGISCQSAVHAMYQTVGTRYFLTSKTQNGSVEKMQRHLWECFSASICYCWNLSGATVKPTNRIPQGGCIRKRLLPLIAPVERFLTASARGAKDSLNPFKPRTAIAQRATLLAIAGCLAAHKASTTANLKLRT